MECQLCLIHEGRHRVQTEGLCGSHAEQVKRVLTWFQSHSEFLEAIDYKKVSQKFGTKLEPEPED